MRIFIYTRKSKFTGRGESIENQAELCRNYIFSHIDGAAEKDITVFEDEGFSGKTTQRPQFKKMTALMRSEPVDYIICYRLDRISRNVSDFSSLIEELSELNVSFVCIKEQFDTSTPMGRAMMYIASVFAQLERETIAERVRDNMYMLARSGRWLGGVTPTGFRSEQEKQIALDDKTRTSYKLVPDPSELAVVKKIFQIFLDTESIAGTAKYLNQHGFRSKNGREFGVESVKSILRNPVYATADEISRRYFIEKEAQICFADADCDGVHGLMPFNRSDHGKHGRAEKKTQDWIIAVGLHEGVISGRDWTYIQSLLNQKRLDAKSGAPSPVSCAILSGVLRCAACSGRMRPRVFTRYIKKDGKPAYYYTCATKDRPKTGTCSMRNANGYQIEDAVCKALLSLSIPAPELYRRLEELKSDRTLSRNIKTERRETLAQRISQTSAEIENLVRAIAQGPCDPMVTDCIQEQISRMETKRRALTEELDALTAEERDASDGKTRIVKEALLKFQDIENAASPLEKKRLISRVVDRIEWDGEDAHLYFK